MSLETRPVFHYGFDVDENCSWIDFREGSLGPELSVQVDYGNYSAEELRVAIENAFNFIGTLSYSVTYDRATRKYSISAGDVFQLLVGTGTHATSSLLRCVGFGSVSAWGEGRLYGDPLLNFGDSDTGLFVVHNASFPAGLEWCPQFCIQDYLDPEDNQKLRGASVNESLNQCIEVIYFGIDIDIELNFKYITELEQSCDSPIKNDPNALSNVRSFFRYAIQKKTIEFMPDKANPNVFHRIRLEKYPRNNTGLGFRLRELASRGLKDFYETGKVTFRRLD